MKKKQSAGFVTIIAGVAWLILVGVGHVRGSATDSWSATDGETVSVNLQKKSRSIASFGSNQGNKRRTEYRADIVYRYIVDGEAFTSRTHHRSLFGKNASLSGSRTYLNNVLNVRSKFKPGTEVKVYYDPDDPRSAVLRQGSEVGLHTALFGLIAVAMGFYQLLRR